MGETEPIPAPSGRRRRARRLAIVGLVMGLLVVGLVVSAPFLLNTAAGNRLIAGRLARSFEPGRLAFGSIWFSWTAPTRLVDVSLADPSGKEVVRAASAILSPSLWGLVTDPGRLGTLDLRGSSFEVERRPDGSIDLAEAIGGILRNPDPGRDLTIRADGATLRLRSPGLPEPARASRLDLLVHLREAPDPTTFVVDLGQEGGPRLRVEGESDRWLAHPAPADSPDFSMTIDSAAWPIRARVEGVDLSCRLDGKVEARREAARLGLVVRSAWNAFHADGPTLRGDAIDLDSIRIDGSFARSADGSWSVDRVEATSPVGSIRAASGKVEGDLDLAAIARQIPNALRLRDDLRLEQGKVKLAVAAGPAREGRREWSAEAKVDGLVARRGGRSIAIDAPAVFRAMVVRDGGTTSLDRLSLKAGFLDATARGDLDRGVRIEGTLDLAALRRQADDWVDLDGLDLAGSARIEAGYRREGPGYVAEARLKLPGLGVDGLAGAAAGPDRATVEATLTGSADGDGWPTSIANGTLTLDSSALGFRAEARPIAGGASIQFAGLSTPASPGGRPPARLTGEATYRSRERRLDLDGLALVTPFGAIRADGRIEAADGSARLDLAGTIAPDFEALTRALAGRVEPGMKLTGRPGTFLLKGSLRADDPIVTEARFLVDGADAFGLRLGQTAILVRSSGRTIVVDPIETTLNEGRLRLVPAVALDADGGPVFRLGKGSTLTDARVNDEVSRRVLSYVAPILNQATRASGLVSMSLDSAEFPIGPDVGRKANVTGSVTFHDVEFAPGPLARQIVAAVAPNKEPGPLRLDAPVLLSIADGRINQRGLSIPIGEVTRVDIEGWVDFDKNLALVASLPVTEAMFGRTPLLGQIAAGTTIRIPIGGTLGAPRLDKVSFNADLKSLGREILARGAGVGTLRLLDALTKPRDPDAPPPPTPAERKALRVEKRNERRKARGLDPRPIPGPR